MTKEELKQYIDRNIYENVDGDISGDSLNEVLKAIVDDGGTEVEANPEGIPSSILNKIKIGETIYTAPQGPVGPQGPQGLQGETGPQGPVGLQGEQGPQGETGATGATGPANTLAIGTVTDGEQAAASITGDAPNQQLNLVLPKGPQGEPGEDGQDGQPGAPGQNAVNPFKGWFDADITGEAGSRVTDDTANLPANPVVGDYAYVKTWDISGTAPSQTETAIVKIYECTTAGTWSDSGRTADTSNVQTFETGEQVNSVGIDDEPTAGSENLVKSGGVYTPLKELDLSVNGGTETHIENHDSTEFTSSRVFNRSTGNYSESTSYATTLYIEIPENTVKIEAFCVNGNTYYSGITYFSSNSSSSWISGSPKDGNETINTLVTVLSEDIPSNAKYIRVMKPVNNTTAYVKFYSTTESEGLVTKVENLEENAILKEGTPTQGNLSEFDENGRIKDSGLSANDVKTTLFDSQVEHIENHDSTEFTSSRVFNRSTGNYSESTSYATTLYIEIPENTVKIEAFCVNGNTYYSGITYFNGSSSWISGSPKDGNETLNSLVTVLSENIPSNAKYVRVMKPVNNTTAYIKFYYITESVGLVTKVVNLEENAIEQTSSKLYGGVAFKMLKSDSMNDGDMLTITDYPTGSKSRGESIVFRANITNFTKISLGKSTLSSGFGSQYSSWIEIDNTNLYIKHVVLSSAVLSNTIPHGLTIDTFIHVVIEGQDDGSVDIIITTLNGQVKKHVDLYGGDGGTIAWMSTNSGYIRAMSTGSSLTNCQLTISNKYIRMPFWIFGASYESTHDITCWPYYMNQIGFDNYFIDAIPGRDSVSTFSSLMKAINLGSPKYLLWTMWGNGTSTELDTYIQKVLDVCNEKGITLIIVDRPNSTGTSVSSVYTQKKAVIDKYINLGVRYWNIAQAVSSNPSSPDGWYSGYLQEDGVHPTALGSRALATQLLVDIPEIMQF